MDYPQLAAQHDNNIFPHILTTHAAAQAPYFVW